MMDQQTLFPMESAPAAAGPASSRPLSSEPAEPLDLTTREGLLEAAVDLVEAVHRAIDWDTFPTNRRMGYWGELESKVNAYARRSLSQFIWRLSSAFNARAPEGPRLAAILESGADREILRVLANDTTLVILKLRARIQARKEAHAR